MKKTEIKSILVIGIMTIIWGGTFPLVKSMLRYISPEMLITYRFFFAAIVALPSFLLGLKKNRKSFLKLVLLGGLLYIAYFAQTVGLHYTEASKSGFITGLYIIFTPIFAVILIKEKPTLKLVLSLILSVIGLALMSGITTHNFSLNKGDLITVTCAIAFALQIVLTNIYAKDIDINFITASQMVIVFVLSMPLSIGRFTFAFPVWVWVALAFLGSVAGYLAILAETYGLKYLDPDRAAILFTLEPVFAGITAFIFLKETLPPKGIIGAVLILVAMWLAVTAKPHVA